MRARSGLSGDTYISGWGLSQTRLAMAQLKCLLTRLPKCRLVCVDMFMLEMKRMECVVWDQFIRNDSGFTKLCFIVYFLFLPFCIK